MIKRIRAYFKSKGDLELELAKVRAEVAVMRAERVLMRTEKILAGSHRSGNDRITV